MEIKYSKKKQEIRKDPFLDFLAQAKEFILAKSNTLIAAGIVFCLLAAGVFVYNYLKKSGGERAQEAFGKAIVAYGAGDEKKAIEAFKTVVDNNKNSPHAVYSAYVLGSMFLREEKYDEAINWFKAAVSNNAKTGFVGADAYEGIADCYEAKGNREEALTYLKKTLEDSRVRYRFPALQWKAALTSKELGKYDDARRFCQQIIADTISQAAAFKQKAENFLQEIEVSQAH